MIYKSYGTCLRLIGTDGFSATSHREVVWPRLGSRICRYWRLTHVSDTTSSSGLLKTINECPSREGKAHKSLKLTATRNGAFVDWHCESGLEFRDKGWERQRMVNKQKKKVRIGSWNLPTNNGSQHLLVSTDTGDISPPGSPMAPFRYLYR